jgi:hypothetical protein
VVSVGLSVCLLPIVSEIRLLSVYLLLHRSPSLPPTILLLRHTSWAVILEPKVDAPPFAAFKRNFQPTKSHPSRSAATVNNDDDDDAVIFNC